MIKIDNYQYGNILYIITQYIVPYFYRLFLECTPTAIILDAFTPAAALNTVFH